MKKFYSEASAALIIFLILVSSTASAATTQSTQPTITETQITTNGIAEQPVIYGNYVVWVDNTVANVNASISMLDLSTNEVTRIANMVYFSGLAIYGNNIVFTGINITTDSDDLYVYNISSRNLKQITNYGKANHEAWWPAIYGNRIVWEDYYNNENRNSDICMYDLSTSKESQITSNGTAYYPAIYGNDIVWQDIGNDNSSIYMLDLSTGKETQITTSKRSTTSEIYGAEFPKIYGNNIVWIDDPNGYFDIYLYNLSNKNENQITTYSAETLTGSPVIYGNTVVWSADLNHMNSNICAYDLITHQQIHTTDTSNQDVPAIYDNKIVWEQDLDGHSNIYMGTITENALEPVLPVANFNSNATEGSVPLDVQFTNLSTNATDLQWNFGDGSSNVSVPNPEHIFTSTGSFNVVLTASNANGSDSKSMAINVQKATPIITWSNPADITYGTALSSTQLNASASVPGTFVYAPPAGTVLPIGAQTLHVDFTPSDTVNYNKASKDVTINVQKTTPKITWNNPADIAYGTKLSSTQLNAKASVLGTFIYTPAARTVLPVGAQALKVTFTPKDTAKYAAATKTVTINVLTVPLADFSASTTTGKAPLPVAYTDKSTGSPSTRTWKFGDGGSLTSKIPYVPVHTYTKKGKYTVSLTVKNVAGSSTKTMSITVK